MSGRCHRCNEEGERSTVETFGGVVTLMATRSYYDEDGAHHYHDPNGHASEFRCSRGHTWTEGRGHPCPSCDFGHGEPTVRYHDAP